MSEYDSPRYQSGEKIRPERNLTRFIGKVAAVGGSGAALAVGVMANHGPQPETPVLNRSHREYTAKPGDTEWSIGTRAYPETDAIEAAEHIDRLNPNPDHLVKPGQRFILGADAQIGRLVNPPAEGGVDAPSARRG